MYSSLIVVIFLLVVVHAELRSGLNGRILLAPDTIEAIISEEHSRKKVEVRILIEEEIDVATSSRPMRDALKASCSEHTAFYPESRSPKHLSAAIPIVVVGVVALPSLAVSVYSVSELHHLAKTTSEVENELTRLRMVLGNVSSNVQALEGRMEAMHLSAIRTSTIINQFKQLAYHGRTPKSLLMGSKPRTALKEHIGVKFTDMMLLGSTAVMTDCDAEAGSYVTIQLTYYTVSEWYSMVTIVDVGSMVNDVYTYYPAMHEAVVMDGKAVQLNRRTCRIYGKFRICESGAMVMADCDYDFMRGSDCGRLNVEKKVEPFVRFITGSVAVVGSPHKTEYKQTDSLGITKTVELPAGTIHLVRSSGRDESFTVNGENYTLEAPDWIVGIPVKPMVLITDEENRVYQQDAKRDLELETRIKKEFKALEKNSEEGLKTINERSLDRFADHLMETVNEYAVYIGMAVACAVGLILYGCSKCIRCKRDKTPKAPDSDDGSDYCVNVPPRATFP